MKFTPADAAVAIWKIRWNYEVLSVLQAASAISLHRGSEDQMLSNPKQTSEHKEVPAIPAYSIFHLACLCVKHCTF